jgi:hypothetical protein
MKFLGHLLLLATVGGILTGCDSSTSSTSTSAVSLTTPLGWTRKDNYPVGPGETADFLLLAPAVGSFSANVLVLTSSASSIGLDSAVQGEIAADQLETTNFTVDSVITRPVSSHDSRILQATYDLNGQTFLMREILTKTATKDVQIVFTRIESDDTYASELLSLESSVQVK